jgi:hypothetical protein
MATFMLEAMNGVRNDETIETARAVRRRDLPSPDVERGAVIVRPLYRNFKVKIGKV